MTTRPPRVLEWLIGLMIPPACREETLGDLHERYRSPARYLRDACSAIPSVVAGRILRTTDPAVLLMEAFALYLAFFGAAFMQDRTFLLEENAPLRLAVPSAIAMLASILEAAYTQPGGRSSLQILRGPILGILAAFLLEKGLRYTWPEMAIPHWIVLNGSLMGLLLISAIRMLFPPLTYRPSGTTGPAFWLKQSGTPIAISPGTTAVLRCLAVFCVVAVAGALTGSSTLVILLGASLALAQVMHELNRRI